MAAECSFLSELKDFEKAALAELKTKLIEAIENNTLFSSSPSSQNQDHIISLWAVPLNNRREVDYADGILLKFLRAREFHVDGSLHMLRSTLRWRTGSIVRESYLADQYFGGAYSFMKLGLKDRKGHPVCYTFCAPFKDAFSSSRGRSMFLRSVVRVMEKGLWKIDLMAPGCVSKIFHVVDLEGCFDVVDRKEVRDAVVEAVQLLQDNYPELVERIILVNVQYDMTHFLGCPLAATTRSQILCVHPADVTKTLLEYIPAESILARYGGFKRENDPDRAGDVVLKLAQGTLLEGDN